MISISSERELAAAVRGAAGALRIVGGGTRGIGKPVAGQVLSVAGMSGIELYEPGALTIVAQAGTPLAEVEAALAAENQRLPFEPMDHRGLLGSEGAPTIGGVVAANVSGPRRVMAGACRDCLIGVRFVDGRGDVIKNGGRVMKNVTGYDLVKLMAGSWGTLGVLSEVAILGSPARSTRRTLRSSALLGRLQRNHSSWPSRCKALALAGRVVRCAESLPSKSEGTRLSRGEGKGGGWLIQRTTFVRVSILSPQIARATRRALVKFAAFRFSWFH